MRVLNQELALNLEREKERNEHLLTLQREIDDLSTPVLLLDAVARKRAQFVILDVTGTHAMDVSALEQLLKVIAAIRLLGAKCVRADIQSVETLRSLGQALDVYLRRARPKVR